MHANTYFLKFSLLYENTIWFFFIFWETWPYAWKQNIFYVLTKKKKEDILIPDLYLYSIKIQTNIDQNTVKYLQKITDFFEINFEEIFFWAGLDLAGPSRVTGPSQWPDWLLNASVREQFTHACYSQDVIKLYLYSVCAIINGRRRNEKLTWFTAAAGWNSSWACN